jgi:excisionase family DNA binding protein
MDTTTYTTATSAPSSTELLTITETAAQLGVSKQTIRRYVKDGMLSILRDERLEIDFVRKSDVDNFTRPQRPSPLKAQPAPEGYVTCKEFAEKFGVTTATINRWRQIGMIPAEAWVRSTSGFITEVGAAFFYSKEFVDTFTPPSSMQMRSTSIGMRVRLPKTPKGFLNVKEFAALAKVKDATAAYWMAIGRVSPVVIDGVVLVKMDEASEFLSNK